MDLKIIAENIFEEKGIWYSKIQSNISYPDDGNEKCYQIEEQSSWFQHRNNCISELIEKHHSEGAFYDIGGGNGFVSKCIQDKNIDTVLVEPGIKGAINAKKRGIKTILCSTLENAAFHEQVIDSAGAFDVIEHIEDDTLFLDNLFKYLRPGGNLFISVPAFNILWSDTDVRAGHFRRYTKASLKNTLLKSGYEVIYISYMFSFLVLPIFIFRSIKSKLKLYKNEIKTKKKEHSFSKFKSVINKLMNYEVNHIKRGKSILFGSSVIVVAKKPS